MLDLFNLDDMDDSEVAYEEYPYKDYEGWNLEIGSIVQFAMDSRAYGNIYKIVQFTHDAKKGLITNGKTNYWVTLSTLRWIR